MAPDWQKNNTFNLIGCEKNTLDSGLCSDWLELARGTVYVLNLAAHEDVRFALKLRCSRERETVVMVVQMSLNTNEKQETLNDEKNSHRQTPVHS